MTSFRSAPRAPLASGADVTTARAGRTAARRAPLFGVLAAGGLSLLGNAVAGVALPWLVLSLTGNAAWTGVAAAVGMVPLVLGAFFGGPVIDRLGARRVAVIADLTSAACVAAIPLLFLMGRLDLGVLLALIGIGALLDGPGMTAQESRYPELARLARLPIERVTAIDELLDNAAVVVGPPLAGLAIVAFGVEATLFVTAACSLAAAGLNALSLPRHRRRIATNTGRGGAVLAGARFLLGDPLLRILLILAMVVLAVFGALSAVVMPAFFRAGTASALDLGVFLAVAGGGAALAALIFGAWGHRARPRLVVFFGLAGAAAAIGGLALADGQVAVLSAATLLGLSVGALGPLVNAVFLRRAPSAIRASVMGASTAAALTATPLAMLAAGAGVEAIGTGATLTGLAALLASLALFAALSGSLKTLDQTGRVPPRRPDPSTPPTDRRRCAATSAFSG